MKKPPSSSAHVSRSRRSTRRRDYLPLLVLLAVAALAASATSQVYDGDAAVAMHWMQDFMGFFLVIFAMLKLFDLRRFADGFQMYDLLAKPFRPYALVYPFVELALGLGYLAEWQPTFLYPATVVVMGFGALGVILSLAKGLDLECACMGNLLKVPLSSVTLAENLAMTAMAAVMWMKLS